MIRRLLTLSVLFSMRSIRYCVTDPPGGVQLKLTDVSDDAVTARFVGASTKNGGLRNAFTGGATVIRRSR